MKSRTLIRLAVACATALPLLIRPAATTAQAAGPELPDPGDVPLGEVSEYEPSPAYPFGRPNPEAPPELAEFAFMIGSFRCVSAQRDPATGEWGEPVVGLWNARYFLNGYGILDQNWREGTWTSNARVYDPDLGHWRVTWFKMPGYGTGEWVGGMDGGRMVLTRPTTTQNGPGVSRLTFYDIDDEGFEWVGEFVSDDGSVEFAFWRISCVRSTRSSTRSSK